MVMADDRPSNELESREPTVEDLRDLCRELNLRGALYVVVGGFAMRAANYNRGTMDVDLIVAADLENEAKVFSALATLPDNAVRCNRANCKNTTSFAWATKSSWT